MRFISSLFEAAASPLTSFGSRRPGIASTRVEWLSGLLAKLRIGRDIPLLAELIRTVELACALRLSVRHRLSGNPQYVHGTQHSDRPKRCCGLELKMITDRNSPKSKFSFLSINTIFRKQHRPAHSLLSPDAFFHLQCPQSF